MTHSLLKPAQMLAAVWCPDHPDGVTGASVKQDGVECILVAQLAGPMGWYDVARVVYNNGSPDRIIPLHMCEQIDLMPAA